MPSDSQKKPAKPVAPRQKISRETWAAIKSACISGMSYAEASRAFGIRIPETILMKSKREHWPVPNRVEQRSRALQTNVLATETLAANWVEKAEQHRALAFQLAHDSLKEAAKKGLPIESWRDADLADKSARRNAGLDSEEGARISIGMALINERLEVLAETLPKEVD
jgi:hypothetical protein